jgi:peptidoglycan/LPS O-acetylase OafA/YrhL
VNSPATDLTSSPRLSAAHAVAADSSRHVPSLDGVRGIAVLLVLAFHAWTSRWTSFGWMGVDLFFVLSGFLITGILVDGREALHRARTFYIRRILRIMPLYYGVLILVFVVIPLIHRPHDPVYKQMVRDQMWYWTYTSNWLLGLASPPQPHYGFMDHFWSLAVEEQFYLIWPLVVWHTSRQTALRIAAGAIVAALVCRIVFVGMGMWWYSAYFLIPCHVDGLAVGSAIALALRAPGDPAATARRLSDLMVRGAIGLGALVIVAQVVSRHGVPARMRLPVSVNMSAVAWIFGWVVLIAATRQPRVLQWKPLRAAGQYSYGLYVIHPLILAYLTSLWPHSGMFVRGLAVVIVSVPLAWLSYHLFEKRFLQLKRRFAPLGDRTGAADGWPVRPLPTVPAVSMR